VDKLVTTPVQLEVQLNAPFEHYQVGVAERMSTDVVSRPIKWTECIHPRNACTFAPYSVDLTTIIHVSFVRRSHIHTKSYDRTETNK